MSLSRPPDPSLLYDPDVAAAHVAAADPVMAEVIRRAGPCRIEVGRVASPFQSLLRAIVYQQLHGKAAATIYGRLLALFPGEHPDPDEVLAMPEEALRAVGLSRAKAAAAHDLAVKVLDGTVPTLGALRTMEDEAIVECLTAVRGVGPWTAEMLLIFHLGRSDVLPATDYGVRNGFRRAFGLDELPTPAALRGEGERWRPYRSVASWYLWRAVELDFPPGGALG